MKNCRIFLTFVLTGVISLLFVQPLAANSPPPPPVAILHAEPNCMPLDSNVVLDGSDSVSGIIECQWEWDYDGVTFTPDFSENPREDKKATHKYTTAGTHTAAFRARNSSGWSDIATCTVKVITRVRNTNQGKEYGYIQPAINEAINFDVIEVNEGIYSENIDFKGKKITLRSTDPNNWSVVGLTIISASDSNKPTAVFKALEDSNSVIAGFKITNGLHGIECNAASPTIQNCIILGNGKTSGLGGGIYDCKSAKPLITNCFIVENDANNGAGIYNTDSNAIIRNCVISENSATEDGGGIYNKNCSPTITNCTFTDNDANNGGGMFNLGSLSEPNIVNCIFWDNEAEDNGNEVYNAGGAGAVFSYCDIRGSGGSSSWNTSLGINNGGNIDSNPMFLLDTNLVSWWRLDDNTASTTVIDSKGYANGTAWRNTSLMHVEGKIGGALDFDGQDDYINTGATFQSTFRDSFSISLWCKPALGYTDEEAFIANSKFYIEQYEGEVYAMYFDSLGQWISVMTDSDIFPYSVTPWTHISVVFKNLGGSPPQGNISIYVNGALVKIGSTGAVNFGSNMMSGVLIGTGSASEDGLTASFDGSLDNIMIFNRVLSLDEVNRLYEYSVIDKYKYHLDSNSPCINAGKPRTYLYNPYIGQRDIDFQGRIIGSNIDIGADEYSSLAECMLTISSTEGGSVTSPGEGSYTYQEGTVVSITATPDANYYFVKWSGSAVDADKVENPYSAATAVTVDGNYILVAEFAKGYIIYVDKQGNDLWNGLYPTYQGGVNGPKRNIKTAVSAASNGDMVVVAEGTYYEGSIEFSKSLYLRSSNPADSSVVASTIIDANGESYVFYFIYSGIEDSILDGLTITGADSEDIYCGGICCAGYSPKKIHRCNIVSNGYGCGVYVYTYYSQPSFEISDCMIMDNGWGGIVCESYGDSDVLISNNVIVNNWNGIIYRSYNDTSTVVMSNNVIARNGYYGIYVEGQHGRIDNCTIFGNCEGIEGYFSDEITGITNCILWDNDYELFESIATYSCIQGGDLGTGNVNFDPCFVDANANNFHLKADSLCIDAGNPASDYSKEPAPNGGRVNIGAYGNTSKAATTTDLDNDGISDNWQKYYWQDYNPASPDPNWAPDGDPDGDGFSNMLEYQTGLNPRVDDSIAGYVLNQRTNAKYPTVGFAIALAQEGDTLIIAPATYNEVIRFNGKNLHIRSTNPDDPNVVGLTVINSVSTSLDVAQFCTGEDSDSILEGLTLSGGNYGVYCSENSSPVISKCIIRNNSSHGVYCVNTSVPQITRSAVRNNSGYGICCADTSAPQISRCRIIGNSSYGIYCYCQTSGMLLSNSVIANNTSYGMYSNKTVAEINNCTIYGNTSYGICGNNQLVRNSIIWGNRYNLVDCKANYCCLEEGEDIALGTGNFSLYPVFIDVANEDFHLWYTSPCIDAGDPCSNYTDEPDYPHGRIDMGAYGNTSEATSKADLDGDNIPDGWELQYWPNDDPNEHNPDDDDENGGIGDGFNNRTEYVFRYDPTSITIAPLEMICYTPASQVNPLAGQTTTIRYILNKNVPVVYTSIKATDSNWSQAVWTKSDSNIVAGELNSAVWDCIGNDGKVVKRYFYDIKIDVNNGQCIWTSQDMGTIYAGDVDGDVDAVNFNVYKNIPVVVRTSVTDWCRRPVDIVRGNYGADCYQNNDYNRIYHLTKDRMLTQGLNTFYWYGRWGDDIIDIPEGNEPNQIYKDGFSVYFDNVDGAEHPSYSHYVKRGYLLVYYDEPVVTNLRCHPYRVIPTNSEVITIKYDLAYDANITIKIYDPDGSYFGTLLNNYLQSAGAKEVVWYGRDSGPNDPNIVDVNSGVVWYGADGAPETCDSRYVYKEGAYRIEIECETTGEKLDGTITVYR